MLCACECCECCVSVSVCCVSVVCVCCACVVRAVGRGESSPSQLFWMPVICQGALPMRSSLKTPESTRSNSSSFLPVLWPRARGARSNSSSFLPIVATGTRRKAPSAKQSADAGSLFLHSARAGGPLNARSTTHTRGPWRHTRTTHTRARTQRGHAHNAGAVCCRWRGCPPVINATHTEGEGERSLQQQSTVYRGDRRRKTEDGRQTGPPACAPTS